MARRAGGVGAVGALARSVTGALSDAVPFALDRELVEHCLDPDDDTDRLFLQALRQGLQSLPERERRGRFNGVTGHVGESVAAAVLLGLGHYLLWHFTGPASGGHGVDLLVLTPAETAAAVEVKATLVAGRWPRPTRGELDQLSPQWLDKHDNPAMSTWSLSGADVYGLVMVINFAPRRGAPCPPQISSARQP